MVSSESKKIRFTAAIARMMMAISRGGRLLVIAISRLSRPSRTQPAPIIHQVRSYDLEIRHGSLFLQWVGSSACRQALWPAGCCTRRFGALRTAATRNVGIFWCRSLQLGIVERCAIRRRERQRLKGERIL